MKVSILLDLDLIFCNLILVNEISLYSALKTGTEFDDTC